MKKCYLYDEQILKQLQETQTQMLKVFDKLCNEVGVEYFISFGTAIGAVRHGGFIPWDDDIDVCMMREDFTRLFRKVPKERWLLEGLDLSIPTDRYEAHTLVYPQLYKLGTVFQTEYHSKYDDFGENAVHKKLPIWIDIFLMDRVSGVEEAVKKGKQAFLMQKLFYYSKSRIRVFKDDPVKNIVACMGKRLTHDLLNLDKRCPEKIYKKYVQFASSGEGEYITSFDLEAVHEMIDCCWRYEDVFPTVRVPFGDITVSLQKNYDEALRTLFGDYMSMPPEEKRYNHPPKVLDFGQGNVIEALED